MQKTHFLNEISSKTFNFWMVLDLIDVYQYHTPPKKKNHPRIPPTTLVLKYICKFSNSMVSISLSQIYSICSNSSMFVRFLEIID
jgi:hypothetical protein